jgi:archaellum component FlaC
MLRSMSVKLNSLTYKIETMDSKIVTMDAKLVKLDHIDTEMKSLRVLMNDLKEENKQLKQEARATDRKLSDMNERNNQLENRLNSLKQHHRGWSARVTNIPLTPEEESNNIAVANKVYSCVLLPILRVLLKATSFQRYQPSINCWRWPTSFRGSRAAPSPSSCIFSTETLRTSFSS